MEKEYGCFLGVQRMKVGSRVVLGISLLHLQNEDGWVIKRKNRYVTGIKCCYERLTERYINLQLIDRALQMLMLHIVWKMRNLKNGSIPAANESQFIDVLKEQRDTLAEKLTEFAVGAQSNVLDTIKRSVSIRLIPRFRSNL